MRSARTRGLWRANREVGAGAQQDDPDAAAGQDTGVAPNDLSRALALGPATGTEKPCSRSGWLVLVCAFITYAMCNGGTHFVRNEDIPGISDS